MKVVVWFRIKEIRWALGDGEMAMLRARFPDVTFEQVEEPAALGPALADAEVFFGFDFPREHFAAARRLRWVQCANAGVEGTLFPALVASDVVVTNAAGVHAVNIPEHALALLLALARNLHVAVRLQAERRWERYTVIAGGGGMRTLEGARLAVLGAGAIGLGIAARGVALGMRVRVMRRRPDVAVPGVEAVVGPAALPDLLAWADAVVLATPLTATTRHLIDADALGRMQSSAYLVNVGRGELIDDDALVEALRTGAIAGAALDAFPVEPLPPEHLYWTLERCLVTPHVSGYMPDFQIRLAGLFADNLVRWCAGEPLRNVVDKRLGYAPL